MDDFSPDHRFAIPFDESWVRLEDQACHLMRRAHQRASAILHQALADHQLTATQFFALARLLERGQLSQNRLGRLSAMDPATIQGVIRRLVDRGLIDRLPDATDRRRMMLRLTAEGRAIVESVIPEFRRADRSVLAPLTETERATFLRLLNRLT